MSFNIPLGYFYDETDIISCAISDYPETFVGYICFLNVDEIMERVYHRDYDEYELEHTSYRPDKIFLYGSDCYYVLKDDKYVFVNPTLDMLTEIKNLLYAMQFTPGMPLVIEAKKRFEENASEQSKGL